MCMLNHSNIKKYYPIESELLFMKLLLLTDIFHLFNSFVRYPDALFQSH